MANPLLLASEFVVLGSDLSASTLAATETPWAEVDEQFGDFAGSSLVSSFAFDEPWPTWEMHPAGDEIVYLLKGETDLVLALPERERLPWDKAEP